MRIDNLLANPQKRPNIRAQSINGAGNKFKSIDGGSFISALLDRALTGRGIIDIAHEKAKAVKVIAQKAYIKVVHFMPIKMERFV